MLSVYQPGTSPLHRLRPAVKLASLALMIVVLSFAVTNIASALWALTLVVLLYLVAGFVPRVLWGQLKSFAFLIALVVVSQLIFGSMGDAVVSGSRVAAALLLSMLVSLTTETTRMIDVVEAMCRPFSRWGVNGARIGFALTLALTAIPVLGNIAHRVREAQRARGQRSSWRLIVPLAVSALKYADDLGDALIARGGE